MAKKLDEALDYLCVDWGFCSPLRGEQLLNDYPAMTPHDFARAVLIAEGMDPDMESHLRRKLVRFYSDRFN